MTQVYISIGSNIDAERHIRVAVDMLYRFFYDLELSSVYESEAIGFSGENFLNLVAGAKTELDVQRVVKVLHNIEDQYGRDRSGPRFSARTLDLDLLLYGDEVINEAGLVLPREEITENAFVLQPLAEIAPDLQHPVLKQSMTELWKAFDKQSQSLWKIDFEW